MLINRQGKNPFVNPPHLMGKVVVKDPECALSYVKDHCAYVLV